MRRVLPLLLLFAAASAWSRGGGGYSGGYAEGGSSSSGSPGSSSYGGSSYGGSSYGDSGYDGGYGMGYYRRRYYYDDDDRWPYWDRRRTPFRWPGREAWFLLPGLLMAGAGAMWLYANLTRSPLEGPIGRERLFTREEVAGKAEETRAFLSRLAASDPALDPDSMLQTAMSTFLRLQECWQARAYRPMEPLLTGPLYRDHCEQLLSMVRNHEINRVDDLAVDWIEPVHARVPRDPAQRQFTALIQARARDYFVDDRDSSFLRGARAAVSFQEFWTFQWESGSWRLRQIEQTAESDALAEANRHEAEGAPAAAPGLPATLDELKETARRAFLAVHAALEQGDPAPARGPLAPAALVELEREISARAQNGARIQFLSLCVRGVDIQLLRGAAADRPDEFVARVSAHAQRVVLQGETVHERQPDVTPFERHLSFERGPAGWLMREILPPA